MTLAEGTRLYLLSPIVRGRKGEYRKELAELLRAGFQRVKIDGKLYELDAAPKLNKKLKHDIELVVDRLVAGAGLEQRLAESIETALNRSDGLLIVENADSGEQLLLSAKFACPVSGFTIEEIEPRLFSFNSPHGACPACDGLGRRLYMDPALVVPDPEKSLYDGAIEPWSSSSSTYYLQTLDGIAKHFRASLHTPWEELPAAMQELILNGSGDEAVELSYDDGRAALRHQAAVRGRAAEPAAALARDRQRLAQGRARPLPLERALRGLRRPPAQARGARGQGRRPPRRRGDRARDRGRRRPGSRRCPRSSRRKQNEIASRILKEINERLGFLQQRRPRLPDARARFRLAVRRREPAHPPRLADRLGPHRRALRARRALDRAAPARQPPPARDAQEPARPRQHGDRGRARRGRDPRGRPRGRHGPGRRRARRHRGRGRARRPRSWPRPRA